MQHAEHHPSVEGGTCHPPCCFIAPPDLLARVAVEGTPEQREAAINALGTSATIRARRALVGRVMRDLNVGIHDIAFAAPPSGESRTVYDIHHGGEGDLPGDKVRGEGDPPSSDDAVNEAYDGADKTYDFYKDVFNRDSLDDHALELISTVHYGVGFDNAFWNGGQMVYGDGSGRIFQEGALTKSLDVIGHEMTHGVTQFTAGLQYRGQSGALNESMSDVFGSLVKQYSLHQTADQADWLIGENTLVPSLGKALRSMKAPGTAFSGDRQPAKMSDYVDLPNDNLPGHDNGGVHINSGIPNHAFFLVAAELGGNAWDQAGRIWYVTLTQQLKPSSQFSDAAAATISVACDLFGDGSREHEAVQKAWQTVGVEAKAAAATGS
jgi:Zn-dependent metalloprotease